MAVTQIWDGNPNVVFAHAQLSHTWPPCLPGFGNRRSQIKFLIVHFVSIPVRVGRSHPSARVSINAIDKLEYSISVDVSFYMF